MDEDDYVEDLESFPTGNGGGKLDYSQAREQIEVELLRKQIGGKQVGAPRTLTKDEWPPDYTRVRLWREQQLAWFDLHPETAEVAKKRYRDDPDGKIKFINHWIDTYDPRNAAARKPVLFPLVMFLKQEELVEFINACVTAEAGGLIEKSRDMGATWVGVGWTVHEWLFGDGPAIGWGSQNQDKVDRIGVIDTVFEKIRLAIRQLPKQFLPRGFNADADLLHMRCVNRETGATVVGEVGDNIGRGGRTMVYFVDEAAHLVRPEAVEAALLANTNVRIDISSVSGTNTVFYRKRESGVDWQRGQKCDRERANVFIMDWSDHPAKTKEWHDREQTRLRNQGLRHVFAREIERDYAASKSGVIIDPDWVNAAVDAHLVLGFDDEGRWVSGLDVADGGIDSNAFAKRKGSILRFLAEWGERDPGLTARRAIGHVGNDLPMLLNYDAIGVGSGVKTETNRLKDEDELPKGLEIVPWVASAGVLDPMDHIDPGDKQSPRNRDFFKNFKAQAWWMVARRFENTYRAIHEPDFTWTPDQVISLPSDLPLLHKAKRELSQATYGYDSQMKIVVNKAPEGSKSPNIGDAIIEAFFPAIRHKARVSVSGPSIVRSG